jgi:DNA-binding CsgD family transcriptional regulator
VLLRKGASDEARALANEGAAAAVGLGMPGFAARFAALARRLDTGPAVPLTSREREVAACVARGLSNAEIARTLFVSERTAQNHVQHILTKLGFFRRSQIAVWAVRHLSTEPSSSADVPARGST